MKKALRMMALMFTVVLTANALEAQTFVNKKLKTEKDGYQWYEHKFKTNDGFVYAAFSMNGKRLTPNSLKVFYYTFTDNSQLPQVFCCWEKKTYIGVDKDNQPQYSEVMSIYDIDGNCIIPVEKEYNSITYDPDDLSYVHCNKYRYSNGTFESYDRTTYSKDGRYWVEGYIYDRKEFDAKKKIVPGASNYVTPTPTPTPQPQPQPQPEPQPRQPQPFQVWQPCGVCGGSGQCQSCLGTGHSLYGTDRCWNCGGNGKCTHCAGQGGRNVIEYH